MALKIRFPLLKVLLTLGVMIFVLGFIQISRGRAVTDPTIQVSSGGDSITLQLEAPAFTTTGDGQVRILDQADKYTFDQPEGQPILPHRVYRIALPPDADPMSLSLVVTDVQTETQSGAFTPILAAPKTLGCAGSCAGSSPASPVSASPSRQAKDPQALTLLPYGQLRKWRYARLDFSPFLYNSAGSRLMVVRSLTATLTFKHEPGLLNAKLLNDTVMDAYAATLFDNYDQAQPEYAAQAQTQPATAAADYVIISTDAIYNHSNLGAFITFLDNHGHTASGMSMTTVNTYPGASTADKIRQFLINNYATWGTQYVLLVGNPDPDNGDVPMKDMYPDRLSNWKPTTDNPQMVVPTDYYYSNLTGNWDLNGDGYPGESDGYDKWGNFKTGDIYPGGVDFTPTVFVGRIPVYNNDYASLNSILNKIMTFEDNPHRQAWQNQAILANTFWGNNYDGAVLGHLIKTDLLDPLGISSYQMYMNQPAFSPCQYNQISSYAHDEDLADEALANHWSSNPVGFMFWSGHGNVNVTALGFGDSTVNCWLNENLFTTDNPNDTLKLNDAYPAFTFLNSCLNGAPSYTNNVGYALLKQGAITTVSASNDTWLDSTGDSEAALPTNYTSGAGIALQYAGNLTSGLTAAESLEFSLYLDSPYPTENLQNHYDFNLYGDPATVYRVPAGLTPEAPSNLSGDKYMVDQNTYFDLSWTDNSSNMEEEFFRISMTDQHAATQAIDVGRNTVKTTIQDVACGKTYDIQVQAGNGSYLSAASNTISLSSAPCIPSAPTGLSASLVNAQITLNWSNNADVKTGFNIYRRAKFGVYYLMPVLAGTVGPNTTTFTDTDVTCGAHNYLYYITAYNVSGESPASAGVSIYSAMCPPAAPSGLAYTAPNETSLHFTWADNSSGTSEEDGFQFWVKPHGLTIWFLSATLPADSTDYTLSNLDCSGAADNYQVVAFNNGGTSPSNILPASTLTCTKPAAPTNLEVNANLLSTTSLNLNWDDNSDNEHEFEIDQCDSSYANCVMADDVPANTATPPSTTSDIISGLTCNTTYYFEVFAYNYLGGNKQYSDPATGSGKTSACDPKAPTRFHTTSVTAGSVALAWDKPSGYIGPAPTGYQVAKLASLGRFSVWLVIGNVPAPTVTYTDPSVSCGHTYYYSVRSVFSGPAYSSYVPALKVSTPICPPDAPATLTATPASQVEIDLAWTPPSSGPEVTGYNLDRADHGVGNWGQIYTGTATSFNDSALTCNGSYDYRVQAYNGSGNGAFITPVVTAQTVVCPPAAPSGLTADTFTQTALTLHWTDNSSNEDGFSIQRSPNAQVKGTEVGTVGAGVVTYPDSTPALTCGTAYYYQVLAYNAGGHSSPSNILKTGTTSCTPTIQATVGGQGLVMLTWADASQTTASYILDRTTTPSVKTSWAQIGTALAGVTKFKDLTAPCGQTLYYRVHAVNPQGSAISLTSNAAQTVCKPNTVMNLTFASSTFHSTHLTWTATSGGQTSFIVLRSVTGTDGWFQIATLQTTSSSYTDDGLAPGSTYYYRLEAINTGGSALSNVVHGTTKLVIDLPLVLR